MLLLVSGFALPHAANTLAAGAEALDRRGQVLLQEGPLAGYLGVDEAFRLPPIKQVDAAARYLDAGQPMTSGVQYVLLVDGVAALRQFKDVSRFGIVSDNGLNFDFALGAPSVLDYPVWIQHDSPEFAGMEVLPAAADLVLVRRRGQDKFSEQLRDWIEGDFTLCKQTQLWDIFARRAMDITACTA
jgi:hypothetical protein